MSKNRMKVAMIGQKGIPAKQGGIEKHVEELSAQLAKAGFDVYVYSRPHYTESTKIYPAKSNRTKIVSQTKLFNGAQKQKNTKIQEHQNKKINFYQGAEIINLPSINTKNLDAITHTFIATIHALFQNYDIIHYHGVGPALLSFIPRILKPSAKVIVTFHCIDRQHQKWGSFAKLMLAWGERAACRFPHETIAISQALKKYCRYRYDTEARYIPNGVAISEPRETEKYLVANNLTAKSYLIAVSRLVRHKGIHTLIKAYNNLKTDKKLVIIGAGANTDDYVSELKKLAQNNHQIIFAGQKSGEELATLFSNAYLFVQPSEAEGLSIALLEAMAYGVPIVISNIEENREATENLAVEFINKNPFDLAEKMAYALANPEMMSALADQAKKRASEEYNWEAIVRNTADLYRQPLLAKKNLIWETK